MKFLFSFLKKLQNKPENIKKRWLWFFVSISMILIIYIWVNTLDSQISSKKEETLPQKNISFWKIFQLGLVDFYQNTFKPLIENFVEKLVIPLSLIFHYLALGWQNFKGIF